MDSLHPALEPARWATLSPLLDELLELDAPERARRIAALRGVDARTAAELDGLLQKVEAAGSENFLGGQAPGVPPPGGIGEGSVCGDWTLERPLGTGGMGSVWLARRADGRFDAKAAIKLPHPGVLARGGAERFEREGRLLARVSHPHIAGLLDAGVAPSGQPYLVLEYVQGVPIDRFCDDRRLGVGERVALFRDVLAAVAHAHDQLVLHRDLKPSNILVDTLGRVKLLDFGIAKLIDPEPDTPAADAAASTRAFTPDHVAPEQLQGEPVGMATDVYALGVLLYQLLTGQHPTTHPGHTPVDRLRAVVGTVPDPVSEAAKQAGDDVAARRSTTARQLVRQLRGDLDTVVAKALKKDPAERYAGAAAFAEDLERWSDGMPVLARPDRFAHRLHLFVRRHRLAVGAAAMGVVLLLGGAAVASWQALEARRERDAAQWQAERAQARSTLLNLMLGQLGTLDAPLTQRELLDGAVRLVESRFADQPRVAVELLLPIAGQYHSMGDVRADLAVMQLAARLADSSGDVELIANTRCSTADTYIKLDRLADADAAIAAGLAALAKSGSPPTRVQAVCWRYEAQVAYVRGQGDLALAAALRSRQYLEQRGETSGNLYPTVLSMLVFAHRLRGDLAAAFAMADELAAQRHARSGGRPTLDAAIEGRNRALLLGDAGEIRAALTLAAELVDRFGPAGAPTVALATLARLQIDSGFTHQAVATLGHIESRARTPGYADPAYLRLLIALSDGNVADARRWFDAVEKSPGALLPLAMPTLGTARAQLLAAEGRTREAVEAIDSELARLDSEGTANPILRASVWRAASATHLAAGDPPRAAAHARAALDASTRSARDPNASAHVGHARLLLARAHKATGDLAAAREAAAQAAGPLARGISAEHRLAVEARALASTP